MTWRAVCGAARVSLRHARELRVVVERLGRRRLAAAHKVDIVFLCHLTNRTGVSTERAARKEKAGAPTEFSSLIIRVDFLVVHCFFSSQIVVHFAIVLATLEVLALDQTLDAFLDHERIGHESRLRQAMRSERNRRVASPEAA